MKVEVTVVDRDGNSISHFRGTISSAIVWLRGKQISQLRSRRKKLNHGALRRLRKRRKLVSRKQNTDGLLTTMIVSGVIGWMAGRMIKDLEP